MANSTPNILIALTAYKNRPTGDCLKSILRVTSTFHANQISHMLTVIDRVDIARVRNAAASFALANNFTHILFVDDDMSFQASLVVKMLRANKPVIGCIYPHRAINLKLALDLARAGHSNEQALAQAIGFATPVPDQHRGNPIAPVDRIGMGIALIHRDSLTKMRDAKCVTIYDVRDGPPPLFAGIQYGFFDPLPGISEDVSFCKRWIEKCDGEIFAVTDELIGHLGDFLFQARYSDLLKREG